MDLALDATTSPTPLKKCIECGDEWITNQTDVTCIVTGNKVTLEVIDSDPIDIDEPYVPNPCKAGKHSMTPENTRIYKRLDNGYVERNCRECYKEYHRAAKRRRRIQKKLALEN